jgi:GT2 family glycosyltransferase
VKLLVNEKNRGFSAGCNQGALAAARPGVLVFLNNDMRLEPAFLRALVGPIVRRECQATTGKMLSWDGKLVNSAGGGMNLHGIGLQRGYLREPDPRYDLPRRTLFACGGAMAIDPAVFHQSGGFDEDFFAYYEDVDLGWRLWVLGHEVHYVPAAVCHHHHSSTSKRLPPETLRLLQTRNPLLACVKNYEQRNLERVLPVALGLFLRRMRIVAGDFDERPFRIEEARVAGPAGPGLLARLRRRLAGRGARGFELPRVAVADLIAANDLLGAWPRWMERRERVQSRRKRPDAAILDLFLKPHWVIEGDPAYAELQEGLSELFGLGRLFAGRTDDEPEPKG